MSSAARGIEAATLPLWQWLRALNRLFNSKCNTTSHHIGSDSDRHSIPDHKHPDLIDEEVEPPSLTGCAKLHLHYIVLGRSSHRMPSVHPAGELRLLMPEVWSGSVLQLQALQGRYAAGSQRLESFGATSIRDIQTLYLGSTEDEFGRLCNLVVELCLHMGAQQCLAHLMARHREHTALVVLFCSVMFA